MKSCNLNRQYYPIPNLVTTGLHGLHGCAEVRESFAGERSRIGLRSSRLDLTSQAQKRSKQRSLVIGSTGRMDVQEGSGIT